MSLGRVLLFIEIGPFKTILSKDGLYVKVLLVQMKHIFIGHEAGFLLAQGLLIIIMIDIFKVQ